MRVDYIDYFLWATILAIGIFLGMALQSSVSIAAFLTSWQTLIAGVLAVGAAVFTVSEMRRVEEKQQRRHDDLMRLNLRPERLMVQRGAPRTRDELSEAVRRMTEIDLALEALTVEDFNRDWPDFQREVRHTLQSLKAALEWGPFRDLEKLLDAETIIFRDRLQGEIGLPANVNETLNKLHPMQFPVSEDRLMYFREKLVELRARYASLADKSRGLIAGLARLEQEYR